MRSQRDANQPHTSMKLYVRSMRCFSPDSTPGVSTRVISSSSLFGQDAPSNFARKPLPYADSPCSTNACSCLNRLQCHALVLRWLLQCWAFLAHPLSQRLDILKYGRICMCCQVGLQRQHGEASNLTVCDASMLTPQQSYCTWYGRSGCTMSVLPGVRRSSRPFITTTKRSVVGSGPM